MNASGKNVVSARQVEDAARLPDREIRYDPTSSIITPLARERANDLGVRLTPTSGGTPPQARPTGDSTVTEGLNDVLVSEVIRRVRQRLAPPDAR